MFGPASQLETDRRSSSAGLAADQRKLASGEEEEEKEECVGVPASRHDCDRWKISTARPIKNLSDFCGRRGAAAAWRAGERPPELSSLTAQLERTAVTWFPSPDR